ncbi:fumarate reductase subunit FrdC [Xenorhabdus bovienii]|uniref:Fumarate reductase subunit C n=2 Tax=Xenorhabdus bovienii TaxID=40576 RepID=A0A077PCK0_XENBV|nr:fumarate reductase subunit FrdC [Xenorhabdus bovienii]MDE9555028.1 fumarate reductase subunit FrdC [Xenorhabdus bovienii]CBJ79679.1 fumarate reductase, anaerobic, membrane anchor polypeptide [Xenorhabdus bovienii SS-2004]CDH18431.1 fumarate reductase, anaerobic, membrane anchor polypeptide [Xenorhabdus bovienii str. kraussei Quebec]
MTTKRKPYVRGMESHWWHKLSFYRFYMIREGTAIPAIWFSLLVLYGLFALKDGPESWAGFVSFLQHPAVLVINIITLLATLLHTKTWFELAPKALNIIVKNEKMSPEPIIKLLWAITIIATAVILGVALFY